MPVQRSNPLIALAGRNATPAAAFFDTRRQIAGTDRLNAATESIKQSTGEQARKIKMAVELESIARGAFDIKPLLERALSGVDLEGNPKLETSAVLDAAKMLQQRADSIGRTGGDTSDTLEAFNLLGKEKGDGRATAGVLAMANQAIETAQQFGVISPPAGSDFAPKLGAGVVTKRVNPNTGEETFFFENPILGPGGFATASSPLGAPPVSRIGESGQETSDRLVIQASETAQATTDIASEAITGDTEAQVRARKQEERHQLFISDGQSAADSLPVLKRALELLETVQTGGIDAAALKIKQLLGLETADEAELNAGLGKAILAQLKSIFGAAFSEKEGARLEGIEANFSKSTFGNIRLLQQQIKQLERDARRGLSSATFTEDSFAFDEITESMNFSLTPVDDGGGDKTIDVDEGGELIT